MKKITSIITLFSLCFCFAQEFPIDFSISEDAFYGDNGASFELTTSNPDSSNGGNGQIGKITAIGNAWENVQLDLATYLDLTTANKTITFDFYSTSAVPVLLKLEGGLNGGANLEVTVNATNAGWQTMTYVFSSANDQYTKLVIFPDGPGTTSGVYYIDNIAGGANGGSTSPSSAPTAPTNNSSDVVSLFSDTFTAVNNVDIDPNWGQQTDSQIVTIGGENVLRYVSLNYQGMLYDASNVTSMEYLHVDLWTQRPNMDLNISLINTSTSQEVSYDIDDNVTLTTGQWVSVDIPLTNFSLNLSAVNQLKTNSSTGGTIFLDNIYFWKTPVAAGTDANLSDLTVGGSTISGFGSATTSYYYVLDFGESIPTVAATTTDANASTTITQATSVPGNATVLVTADDNETTKTYTVSFILSAPTAAAPNPVVGSSNVVSVYSDTYTSIIDNSNPNWGQATSVSEVTIGGNNALKYTGLNYQGMEYSTTNVSSMDYVHLDYYTANSTDIDFFAIKNGQGTELAYSITDEHGITLGQWVSIDIPLSHYGNAGVDLTGVNQFKTVGNGTIWLDNIYFWKDEPTWTGNTDSDWSVAGNWSPAQIPTSLADITVPSNATINISGNKTVNSMNVSAGASIISTGTITGNVTYTRSIGTTNWYLISSPVGSQDIDTFVAASNLAAGGGSNVGFSSFDEASNQWTYYQSGTSVSSNFTEGKGHSIKLASTGNISFTGTFNSSNSSISMTDSNLGYNLIGNPYLSSVSVIELINQNSAALEELTVWLWNQSADAYVPKNLAADLEVAPGQGFFVQADGAGTFQITETMQSHSSDTFQRTMSRPEMLLTLNNGEITRTAEIYYVDGATTGFDNGFDSSIFGSVDNSFAIYTRTVNGDSDNNLGIQSLPTSNYENMVIPVGINALAGTNISISVSPNSIPDGIEVYLEDTLEETFTLMNDENVYSNVLLNDYEGIGRYYLHTTADNLGNDNPYSAINNITVFPTERDGIRILNLPSGKTNIKMYDLLGKILLNTSINGGVSNNVSLPNLTTGIYVVKLITPVGTKNQKIIIK